MRNPGVKEANTIVISYLQLLDINIVEDSVTNPDRASGVLDPWIW
jgi:hypothetical protein